MIVDTHKLQDEVYEKFEVEDDDFNHAMVYYNLHNDPEIRALMMRTMSMMGMGGGGMGGGMGGMFGQ